MKIGWMLSEIFDVFLASDTFSTWKMETKLCSTSVHSAHTLYNSSTAIIIRKQFSNWLNSFLKITENMCSSLPLVLAGKGSNFMGKRSTCIVTHSPEEKVNLHCHPLTRGKGQLVLSPTHPGKRSTCIVTYSPEWNSAEV